MSLARESAGTDICIKRRRKEHGIIRSEAENISVTRQIVQGGLRSTKVPSASDDSSSAGESTGLRRPDLRTPDSFMSRHCSSSEISTGGLGGLVLFERDLGGIERFTVRQRHYVHRNVRFRQQRSASNFECSWTRLSELFLSPHLQQKKKVRREPLAPCKSCQTSISRGRRRRGMDGYPRFGIRRGRRGHWKWLV